MLDPVDAVVRQKDIAAMLVAGEIRLGSQLARDRRHLSQTDAGLVDVPRNHEGNARLVDQDRVGLVDQCEPEGTVHQTRLAQAQAVTQQIEARLPGRHVRDVAPVGRPALGRRHALLDVADGQTEHAVDGAHPGGVSAREVVVERQDVRTVARERIEGHGRNRGQRLALACLHLRDLALIHRETADDLLVERTGSQHPFRCLTDQREQLVQHQVERCPLTDPRLEPACPCGEPGVVGRGHLGRQAIDPRKSRHVRREIELDRRAENPPEPALQCESVERHRCHPRVVDVLQPEMLWLETWPGATTAGTESSRTAPEPGRCRCGRSATR